MAMNKALKTTESSSGMTSSIESAKMLRLLHKMQLTSQSQAELGDCYQ